MILIEAIDRGYLELAHEIYNTNEVDSNARKDRPWMLDIMEKMIAEQKQICEQLEINTATNQFSRVWNVVERKRHKFLEMLKAQQTPAHKRTKEQKNILKNKPHWTENDIELLNYVTKTISGELDKTDPEGAKLFEMQYTIGLHLLKDGDSDGHIINIFGVCKYHKGKNPEQYQHTWDRMFNQDPHKVHIY